MGASHHSSNKMLLKLQALEAPFCETKLQGAKNDLYRISEQTWSIAGIVFSGMNRVEKKVNDKTGRYIQNAAIEYRSTMKLLRWWHQAYILHVTLQHFTFTFSLIVLSLWWDHSLNLFLDRKLKHTSSRSGGCPNVYELRVRAGVKRE